MAKKDETSRRDYIRIPAVLAEGEEVDVWISHRRMQTVGTRSLGHAKECGYSVPHVLQNPTAIFEGLRHDEDEDKAALAGGAIVEFRDTPIIRMGRSVPLTPARCF